MDNIRLIGAFFKKVSWSSAAKGLGMG